MAAAITSSRRNEGGEPFLSFLLYLCSLISFVALLLFFFSFLTYDSLLAFCCAVHERGSVGVRLGTVGLRGIVK